MATQASRKLFSWSGLGVGALLAVIIGTAGAYLYVNMMPEKPATPLPPTPAANATRTPPPPPKIELAGMGKVADGQAKSPDGSVSADLALDDAAIIWLKLGESGGGGGRLALPLTIKDSDGRDYSYSVERKDGGLVALHLKKGYDKKPDALEIAEVVDKKTIGSWKVQDIPAPTEVLADSALRGAAEGIVQLRPGRRGRLGAVAHFTTPLKPDEGMIVRPVSASYTPIDTSRLRNGFISKPGETPYETPFGLPNPQMARRVAFDVTTYRAVTKIQTVTFKTARLEVGLGQPYLVVDQDEKVTTPDGSILVLAKQNHAPRLQPKRARTDVIADVLYDGSANKVGAVPGITPVVALNASGPDPNNYGLGRISIRLTDTHGNGTADVLSPPDIKPLVGTPGQIKTGPIPELTVQLITVHPQILTRRRVVLPVDPKPLPPPAAAGAPGR